jgi:hypothetical protein
MTFFIGIDLGIERKKTSAICILEKKNQEKFLPLRDWCQNLPRYFWERRFLRKLKPYLKDTKSNCNRCSSNKRQEGRERMRLFENFFSRKPFLGMKR